MAADPTTRARTVAGALARLAISAALVALLAALAPSLLVPVDGSRAARGAGPPAASAAPASPSASAAAAARPSGPLVPARGALFGTTWRLPPDVSENQAAYKAAYAERERALGRRYAVVQRFYRWYEAFPTWQERYDVAQGRTPLISWDGVDTRQIAAGRYDKLIVTRARAVKALGAPVFMRWMWEMDRPDKAAVAISPGDYAKAWRHIRDVFREQGAANVVWVWGPTAWGMKIGRAQAWYPGGDTVDWISASAYNWGEAKPDTYWRSLAIAVAEFYDFGTAKGKPMMLAEWGSVERAAGEKAYWLARAQRDLKGKFPNIAAVIYFDVFDRNHGTDWRTTTSPSSFKAFRTMGLDPYFRA